MVWSGGASAVEVHSEAGARLSVFCLRVLLCRGCWVCLLVLLDWYLGSGWSAQGVVSHWLGGPFGSRIVFPAYVALGAPS